MAVAEGMMAGDIWAWRERQPFAPDLPLLGSRTISRWAEGGRLGLGPFPCSWLHMGFWVHFYKPRRLGPHRPPLTHLSPGPLSPVLPFSWRFSAG